MDRKPELLAPAGDLERLKWAFLYGADAVYFGGPSFELRANATNITMEDIQEGVTFAHDRNRKVYVTVNIALHDKEVKELVSYLKKLDEMKVDAIIVSDPSVIMLASKHTNLEIHLSTQQSTLNYEAVSFWKKHGVTRIVLGRETTKEEIEEIRKKVDIELECFIHGAMCASYSGRCVLSNFLTARDSNRGGCSQICRWDFDLVNEKKESLKGDKPFTFCTKDLSMLEVLPEMIELGITSFKIEGRMRSIYYIATIVNICRKAIDEIWNQKENYVYNKTYEKILARAGNRDSVVQFFKGNDSSYWQYYNGRVEVSNQDFLGVVLDYDKEKHLIKIEQRNFFKVGDSIEIFGPEIETKKITIKEIFDENMNKIEIVRHPQQIVYLPFEEEVFKNNLVRIDMNF